MLLEFTSHLLAFDLNWLVMLILGNLHWVFALFAFTFIAEQGKRPVWHFLIAVGGLYAFSDIMGLLGWIFAPFFIIVAFQIFLMAYFPEGSWPRKNFVKIVYVFLPIICFIATFYYIFPGGY
ncbi:MAG: hypothetical protein JW744_04985 [Candidatus Diapherotrites archaeon]|uniref:Uncharacterized protein n=1 Tax=Candidatus Iainarchaeum sp. TaxID=3101447 RepID=A0A938YTG3_9ARCH|nr:hypothetical protein [Candidatus Diapherotrites archaeon]